jgi:hypothetical protein
MIKKKTPPEFSLSIMRDDEAAGKLSLSAGGISLSESGGKYAKFSKNSIGWLTNDTGCRFSKNLFARKTCHKKRKSFFLTKTCIQ